jgi:hypothetical protein
LNSLRTKLSEGRQRSLSPFGLMMKSDRLDQGVGEIPFAQYFRADFAVIAPEEQTFRTRGRTSPLVQPRVNIAGFAYHEKYRVYVVHLGCAKEGPIEVFERLADLKTMAAGYETGNVQDQRTGSSLATDTCVAPGK